MTTALKREAIIERLRNLLEGEADGGTLATATARIAPVDALAVFACAAGKERVLWMQPSEDAGLAAVGVAARFTGTGAARFKQVAEAWREAMASSQVATDSASPAAMPLALGGFAFDPEGRDAAGPWSAFPDAELVVPLVQVWTQGGACWLTVNARSPADANEAETMLDGLLSGHRASDESAGVLDDNGGASDLWRDAVGSAVRRIRAGEMEKVVLAREALARGRFDIVDAIDRLRSAYGACTVFAFDRGGAAFVGATPERLVRLDGRRVQAASLASSRPRGATPEEDEALGLALLADPKEREEHALVVRELRSALSPVCSQLSIPETPELLRMPNVQHLYTPVEGVADARTAVIDLVERLHPTPATGGAPRDAALEVIRESESFDRGWYAGAAGWVARDGGGEFAVAIRSALVRDGEARLYAGCGIVADSDPEQEYEESCLKLRPMRWALNLD